MSRIPVSLDVLPAVGKVIAEASADPARRAEFLTNPATALIAAGVPASSLAGLQVVVHEDTASTLNIVLPVVDAGKVAAGDAEYLALLGTVTVMGCHFDVIDAPVASGRKVA